MTVILLFYLPVKNSQRVFCCIKIFFLKLDYREVNDENVLCRDLSFPYNSDMITLQVKLCKRENKFYFCYFLRPYSLIV